LGVTNAFGLPLPVAAGLSLVIMFVVGYALQRFVLERVLGNDILPPLLVTFGLSIAIQNGLLLIAGADSRRLQAGVIEIASIPLGPDLHLGVLPVITLLTAIGLVLLLQFVFYRTSMGRAFRATSDNPAIAELMGIRRQHVYAVAVGISLVVAGLAAVSLGIRANFDPSIGPSRLLYAFEAVIIGGLGSLWGTLTGGIILGIAQAVGARFDPEWQILCGHLAFLAVLFVRPRGLFPRTR
jgi:branched-chain amino acid transport system permease protein